MEIGAWLDRIASGREELVSEVDWALIVEEAELRHTTPDYVNCVNGCLNSQDVESKARLERILRPVARFQERMGRVLKWATESTLFRTPSALALADTAQRAYRADFVKLAPSNHDRCCFTQTRGDVVVSFLAAIAEGKNVQRSSSFTIQTHFSSLVKAWMLLHGVDRFLKQLLDVPNHASFKMEESDPQVVSTMDTLRQLRVSLNSCVRFVLAFIPTFAPAADVSAVSTRPSST